MLNKALEDFLLSKNLSDEDIVEFDDILTDFIEEKLSLYYPNILNSDLNFGDID